MKYMGSKNRYAKYLLPIVLKDRILDQWYVEPFVGGANMIDKVDGNRIGNDSNEYLIALLNKLQTGWIPPYITEGMYEEAKHNPTIFDKYLLGFIGFQLSYGAMWFGSYRRDSVGKRDYAREAINNVTKQASNLKGIRFTCSDYKNINIPNKSIIYCDPPYKDTASYKAVGVFNHSEFWEWCNQKVYEGHKVFVSEYTAPDDWICVWEKQVNSSLTKNTGGKKATERLFTKV